MNINWNNAADADGYVVVQEKQKRKISRLSVLERGSRESIFSRLFEDTERKDADSDEQ